MTDLRGQVVVSDGKLAYACASLPEAVEYATTREQPEALRLHAPNDPQLAHGVDLATVFSLYPALEPAPPPPPPASLPRVSTKKRRRRASFTFPEEIPIAEAKAAIRHLRIQYGRRYDVAQLLRKTALAIVPNAEETFEELYRLSHLYSPEQTPEVAMRRQFLRQECDRLRALALQLVIQRMRSSSPAT